LRSRPIHWTRVARLVRFQSELFPPDAPDAVVRRWLVHVGPDLVPDLLRLGFALWRARHRRFRPAARGEAAPGDLVQRARHVRRIQQEHPPLHVGDLAIGGHELGALGLEPGPRYGEILRRLLDRVLERPELNTRESLLELAREEIG
jgi:tRNA nucleotidyltransferase (CCA-adding enzyme)